MDHQFQQLDFNGAKLQSCMLCLQLDTSPAGREPCKGIPPKEGETLATPPAIVSQTPKLVDLSALVKSLDAEMIQKRIDELDEEKAALSVLLAMVKARDAQKTKVSE